MSFTVFLGNLPVWVTADDIKQWLSAEDLVADSVKVIRNHETQESKGFAFVEAPTQDEMQAIIRRFDRAPLEDKVLRANPAQPSKGAARSGNAGAAHGSASHNGAPHGGAPRSAAGRNADRPDRRGNAGGNGSGAAKKREQEPKSAFATELAKVL
jgi:RNA recognition motif-containing protein